MNSHQPSLNNLAFYTQKSDHSNLVLSLEDPYHNDFAMYPPHFNPLDTSSNSDVTSHLSNMSSTLPPSPPQQNNANIYLTQPTPDGGRTRHTSYQPPPVTTATWPESEYDMAGAFASFQHDRLFEQDRIVSDFSTNHQRHSSYPGIGTGMANQPTGIQNSQFQHDFLPIFQFQPTPIHTVQPSAIFKNDTLYTQTAAGTPDTSARGTPFDEGAYLSVSNGPVPPAVDNWQSSASNLDQLPSLQSLHVRQYSSSSLGDLNGSASPVSEHGVFSRDGGGHPMLMPRVPEDGDRKKRTRTPQACEGCRKRKAKVCSTSLTSANRDKD